MKCSNIKLLLSEYIDGTLDEKARFSVEQHLQACETCQHEYASLKNIIGDLGELPKVKAPDDFLESVHTKMESGFDLSKLFRKLFVPFKIKVPLEILTAAATAIIIIFFVNVYQKENYLPNLMVAEKPESLSDDVSAPDGIDMKGAQTSTQKDRNQQRKIVSEPQPKEDTKKVVSEHSKHQYFKKSKASPSPLAEKKKYSYQSKTDEEEVKTSRITTSKFEKEQSLAPGKTSTTPMEKKEELAIAEEVSKDNLEKPIELALVISPTLESTSKSLFAGMDKLEEDVSDVESKTALGSSKKEGETSSISRSEKEMLMKAGAETSSLQLTRKRIEAMISDNSGKIISEKADDQTGQPKSILAEIPSSNFNSFFTQLTQIGRIKQPLSDINLSKNQPLRINILLIHSQ
jgi:hypothetical protein